jgi:quercetin dioxygenase-like cupin family protein
MTMDFTVLDNLSQQIEEIPPDSILSQTLHDDADVKVTLFGFAPGQELTEHTAGHPVVLLFLRGKGTLELADEPHGVGPGSWVHMPAHLPHSVHADTELVFVLHLLK